MKKENQENLKFDTKKVCLKPSKFGNDFGLGKRLEVSKAGKSKNGKKARKRERKRLAKSMEENLLAFGNFSLTTEPSTTDKDGDTTMKDNSNFTVTRYDPCKRDIKKYNKRRKKTEKFATGAYETQWYQINVKDGGCDGLDVIKNIQTAICEEFQYSQFAILGNDVQFYVQGKDKASSICKCNKSISNKAGTKMKIQKVGVDAAPYTNEQLTIVQQVLKSRCIEGKLCLSNLHMDPVLKQHSVFFKLKENHGLIVYILSTFLDGSTIKQLDLSNNKLKMKSSQISHYVDFLPNITALNLQTNMVEKTDDLLTASEWKHLSELDLTDNPVLIKNHSKKVQYTEDLRTMFPKLQKLDNCELKSQGWEYLQNINKFSLPEEKGNNFAAVPVEARSIFFDFVTKYFMSMDGNRGELRQHFHEESSLTVQTPRSLNEHIFAPFYKACTQLKNRSRSKTNSVQIVSGVDRIMKVLGNFPKTKHFQQNFVCDVTMCHADFVSFAIHGIFEETEVKRMKSFSCLFFCVIENTKMMITNCMLHIKAPSHDELKKLSKTPEPTAVANTQQTREEVMRVLCGKLSSTTNMNAQYALECMKKNNWNIERALLDFENVKATLPPDAFNS